MSSFEVMLLNEVGQLPPDDDSLESAVDVLVGHVRKLARQGIHGPTVVSFEDSELYTFTFRGTPPVAFDDLVRGLAASRRSRALAVVTVEPVPPQYKGKRALRIQVEARTGEADLWLVSRGPRGTPAEQQVMYMADDPPGPRWLGVPTSFVFDVAWEGSTDGPGAAEA